MFKLLVVEDEEMIRSKILNNIDWKKNGFSEVFSASDGQEALEIARRTGIDLLITDIQMPNLNGIELIREVKRINREVKTIIITAYAEFEYAKESIRLNVNDYMLKPFISKNLLEIANKLKEEIIRERSERVEIENLVVQLRENKKALQDKLFSDLLSNNFIGNIENNLEYLGLSTIKGVEYFVAVLNMDDFEELIREEDEEHKYICNLKLFNWVKKFLAGFEGEKSTSGNPDTGYYAINYKTDQVVIVFYSDLDGAAWRMEELIDRAGKDLGYTLTVGIGNQYQNLRDMYISYREACSAALLSCIHGKGTLYNFNDINYDNKIYSKELHILVDNKLYDDLRIGAFEEIKKDIEEILREIKNSRLGVDSINTIINNIILLSCKTVNELGYNVLEIFGNHFTPYFDIRGISALVQLEEWFLNFFSKINDYINQRRKSRNESLIIEVKEYIDRNFVENITLTSLSRKFSISTGYLSILFNDHTGQNFIDYISNLRIQKAKEFLKNSDLRVYEIAERVGYRDAYYFSSAFKRIVGINPTEYRDNLGIL